VTEKFIERLETSTCLGATYKDRIVGRLEGLGERGKIDVGYEVAFIDEYERFDARRGCGAEVTVDDEEIGHRRRGHHGDQEREIGNDRLGIAAQRSAGEEGATRQNLGDVDLGVSGVFVTSHPITANHLQATPERSGLNDTSRVVANPDMTPVRGNDLRFEFQDRVTLASDRLSLNRKDLTMDRHHAESRCADLD